MQCKEPWYDLASWRQEPGLRQQCCWGEQAWMDEPSSGHHWPSSVPHHCWGYLLPLMFVFQTCYAFSPLPITSWFLLLSFSYLFLLVIVLSSSLCSLFQIPVTGQKVPFPWEFSAISQHMSWLHWDIGVTLFQPESLEDGDGSSRSPVWLPHHKGLGAGLCSLHGLVGNKTNKESLIL